MLNWRNIEVVLTPLVLPLFFLGLASVWIAHLINGPTYLVFAIFYTLLFIVVPPKNCVTPLSMFYAYYGLSYVIAPAFAGRYHGVLELKEYSLSLAFAFTVFSFGILSIRAGESIAKRQKLFSSVAAEKLSFFKYPVSLKSLIIILYFLSTLMVMAIVYCTGGIERWLSSPGDAFLNRAGSGVYVILSHFFSITLALLVGYTAYAEKNFKKIALFLFWVFITSPVHGSKLQTSLLLLLVLLPWVKRLPLFNIKAIAMYAVFVGIFLTNLVVRQPKYEPMSVIKSSLNYFSVLENLAISVRDFKPDVLKTFFLPFVKFQTPFGLAQANMYYDMNHFLTDKYYPQAWSIRATEQWPVETDLYLNFMFFGGLPLVALYLFVCGYIYGRAVKMDSLGHWAAAFLMTVLMFSHLRGSLINHTDFYMYPFILLLFYKLKTFTFQTEVLSQPQKH